MVIAVTRGGAGRAYRFASAKMADAHPLVQYGDPIMCGPEDLRVSLLPVECAQLADRAGERSLAAALRTVSISEFQSSRHVHERLWKLLETTSSPPSTDHTDVFREIVSDRVATRRLGVVVRPRGVDSMSESHKHEHEHDKTPLEKAIAETDPALTETVKAEETKTESAPAAEETKKAPPPREPKFPDSKKITLLKDKEGKTFGKEHNPKKPNSASFDRFARYVDGMTIKQALDAGILRGDLDHDSKKSFISVD